MESRKLTIQLALLGVAMALFMVLFPPLPLYIRLGGNPDLASLLNPLRFIVPGIAALATGRFLWVRVTHIKYYHSLVSSVTYLATVRVVWVTETYHWYVLLWARSSRSVDQPYVIYLYLGAAVVILSSLILAFIAPVVYLCRRSTDARKDALVLLVHGILMGLVIVFVLAPLFAAGLASPGWFVFALIIICFPLCVGTSVTVRMLRGKCEYSGLLSFMPLFSYALSAPLFFYIAGLLTSYYLNFRYGYFMSFSVYHYFVSALLGYPALLLSSLISCINLHARAIEDKVRYAIGMFTLWIFHWSLK